MTQEQFPEATPKSIVARLAETAADYADHAHPGEHATIREADHKGHHIVVRTTYAIEVDRVPIEGHLGVTGDGRVHYHAIPNVSFASAVDLVKQLIDAFPDDFPQAPAGGEGLPPADQEQRQGHRDDDDHAGHQH
jgi:hypothetical protein